MNVETHYQRNRLLILGAGLMQLPVICAAKLMGVWVIVADANEHAVGVTQSDEFWHIDLQDIDRLVESAKNAHLQGVMTCATDFSYAVACITDACGLVGICPTSAQIANYKNKMRDALLSAGVPVPKYLNIGPITESANLKSLLVDIQSYFKNKMPLVIKPVDNMGARGVYLISDIHLLETHIIDSLQYSHSKQLIIEEYLSGPELSIDSFIQDGILYPLGIADRHIYFQPHFIETGHTIPSAYSIAKQEEACNVLEQAARAAGILNGFCKGDIIFHHDKAYIGEFAARLSGGYMSGWTIPYSLGNGINTNPSHIAVKHALGMCIDFTSQDTITNSQMFAAERALLMLPGILEEIQIDATLYQSSGFQNIFINVQEGTHYSLPQYNPQKAGSIIATGITYKLACTHASEILTKIYFKVYSNEEANTFLFSLHDNKYTPWRCYSVQDLEYEDREKLYAYTHNKDIASVFPLPLWIPPYILSHKEIGTWTHTTISELLKLAIEQQIIIPCDKRAHTTGGRVWSALLRGGWQGLQYLVRLLQSQHKDLYLL